MPEFQANRRRMKQSSNSKRIKKKTPYLKNVVQQRLKDGQAWQNEENPSSPNKERIRRIQNEYKINGIDLISL